MTLRDLQFHHIGCLTRRIDECVQSYSALGFEAPRESVRIESQKVRVCFVPMSPTTFIELVEPDPDNAFLTRQLEKNTNFYHLGFLCDDLRQAEGSCISDGAHVVNRFRSEAFDGRECMFLVLTNGQLIELIAKSAS